MNINETSDIRELSLNKIGGVPTKSIFPLSTAQWY